MTCSPCTSLEKRKCLGVLSASCLGKAIDIQALSLDLNPAICVVLRSEHPGFKPGDHVHGFLRKYSAITTSWYVTIWCILMRITAFEQYTVVTNPALVGAQVIENKEKLPWSVYVGVCGYPGMFRGAYLLSDF